MYNYTSLLWRIWRRSYALLACILIILFGVPGATLRTLQTLLFLLYQYINESSLPLRCNWHCLSHLEKLLMILNIFLLFFFLLFQFIHLLILFGRLFLLLFLDLRYDAKSECFLRSLFPWSILRHALCLLFIERVFTGQLLSLREHFRLLGLKDRWSTCA